MLLTLQQKFSGDFEEIKRMIDNNYDPIMSKSWSTKKLKEVLISRNGVKLIALDYGFKLEDDLLVLMKLQKIL